MANEALVGAIQRRLAEDDRISAMAIDVNCCEGYVCLIGVVDTEEQKALAEELVAGMVGVRGVRNHIELRSPRIEPAPTSW